MKKIFNASFFLTMMIVTNISYAGARAPAPLLPLMQNPISLAYDISQSFSESTFTGFLRLQPEELTERESFTTSDGQFFVGQELACFYAAHSFVSPNFVLDQRFPTDGRNGTYRLTLNGTAATEIYNIMGDSEDNSEAGRKFFSRGNSVFDCRLGDTSADSICHIEVNTMH